MLYTQACKIFEVNFGRTYPEATAWAPLSTLRAAPRGAPRMTQGQSGLLFLSCSGFSPSIGHFIIEVMLQRLKKERIRAGLFAILFNASWVFLISSSLLVAWCAFNSCDFK